MKKSLISMTVVALAAFIMAACESKPAAPKEEAEKTEAVAQTNLTPESIKALIDADWDAVPQELLDTMGIKTLKAFKQEVKEAQNDNLQYYFGQGATVEIDEEGMATKITIDGENAVVIHLTAESVAYGSIAFSNEADYKAFLQKVEAYKANAGEDDIEFADDGKNVDPEGGMPGFEAGKWFIVSFTSGV